MHEAWTRYIERITTAAAARVRQRKANNNNDNNSNGALVLFPLYPRDLMLVGTQQSAELKLALDQEQSKSKKLQDSMRKLDEEMKRTDELLYQMIPKQVADRLRKGQNPIDTCQVPVTPPR